MNGYFLLLLLGVFACSTSVLWIKGTSVPPIQLAAWRQLFAAALLLPLYLRDRKRFPAYATWKHVRRTILPGLLLGVHFIIWNLGAKRTAVVNASLLCNTLPVASPFLLYLFVREKLSVGEWLGTGVTLLGLGLLIGMDFQLNQEFIPGDVLCLVAMVLVASYLILARRNRDFPSIWLYVVPLYLVGGSVCLLLAAPTEGVWTVDTSTDLICVLGLAIGPTVIGHSALNLCMKNLRGQLVSLASLGQFIFAGGLAYLLRDEIPHWPLYPAGACIVLGAAIALRAKPKNPLPNPNDIPDAT